MRGLRERPAGVIHVSIALLSRNKDSLSLLLTVAPRVFDLGRIAVTAT